MPAILLHLMPHIVSSLLYGGLGAYFWYTRWRETGRLKSLTMRPWEHLAILLALLLQSFGLYDVLFADGGMRFSFSLALSLMLWMAVLIYWLESFRARMDGLQPMVLPLAAVCAILPVLFPLTHSISYAAAPAFKLHFLAAMLAYSLFTLSALHAIFMGVVERKLHRRRIDGQLSNLPPYWPWRACCFG